MTALRENFAETIAAYWQYGQLPDEHTLVSLRQYYQRNRKKITEEQYAIILLTECVMLRLLNKHHEADELSAKELKRFNRIRNTLFAHRWKRMQLVEEMRRGKSNEVYEQVQQLVTEAQNRQWQAEHMRALNLQHIVEATMGLFKKALETALQLKYVATTNNDIFHIREASWNIAHTYQRFGHKAEALAECEKILPLFGDDLLQPLHIPFYLLLGACYFENGLMEKAIEVNRTILNALKKPNEHEQHFYIGAASNLAEALVQKGDYEQAEEQYLHIRAFAAKTKWPHFELTSSLSLCRLYFKMQQYGKMKTALDITGKLIQKIKLPEFESQFLEWQAAYEKATGNYEKALQHYEDYHRVNEEWRKFTDGEKIKSVELKYELQLEHLKQDVMKKENQLQEQELQMLNTLLQQKDKLIQEFASQYKELEATSLKRKAIFARLNEMVHNIEFSANAERENYSTKFNEAHLEAVAKIQQHYPALSNTEAKIAVMLTKDLNNKEISTLTLTTIRNIEATRLRIRKKMNLNRNDDLLKKIREAIIQ